MGDSEGGYKPWWAIDKEAWRKAFGIYYKIQSVCNDPQPLPPWTSADVAEFAKVDPIHGEHVQALQKAGAASAVGAVIGGLSISAYLYRHSRNIPGAFLALVGGSAVSWAMSEEVSNYALGLYKFNGMDSNLKFLEWRRKKAQQGSY